MLVEVSPPAALRDRVLSLWVHRAESAVTRRIVPDGCTRVVCHIGAPVEVWARLEAPAVEQVPAGSLVVGARLRPDAHRLDDSVCPAWLGELGERLAQSDSAQSALRILARGLAEPALIAGDRDQMVARSVDALLDDPLRSVDDLVHMTSLSAWQWRRRFIAATGSGPKTLQRLWRFQLVLWQLQQARYEAAGGPGLAPLATLTGYFDQAHLANECRRLTGRPLGSFVRETRSSCSRGHDHAAAFSRFAVT